MGGSPSAGDVLEQIQQAATARISEMGSRASAEVHRRYRLLMELPPPRAGKPFSPSDLEIMNSAEDLLWGNE